MVRAASPDARPGNVVAVYDKRGDRFGSGFYNPRSRITVRMLSFTDTPIDDAFFEARLAQAVSLRRDILQLDQETNAYRVVHAEGDALSGLVVDRFDDVLSVEAFALGPYLRIRDFLPQLHALCGTQRQIVRMDSHAAELEGAKPNAASGDEIRSVRIEEHGVRFAVDFAQGQKTGFFCDQRENRQLFAAWARGRSMLDLCCYTGGFSIYALKKGGASDVTGVDLDEKAIDQARHNANLNQVRARWVHADAFKYMRQMGENDRNWESIVLDPPKLIVSRDRYDEGERKYFDLNRLALQLVAPGGLFVTCSCSGLMPRETFEKLVVSAARSVGRPLQILRSSGASPDHPGLSTCPESLYLNVLWARVLERDVPALPRKTL
jgi:23S rRNA (cytosine1962-C5)-methyltransferase